MEEMLCIREGPALLWLHPPLADKILGSRGGGLEGALEEMIFSQNHWVLGRADILVLEEVMKEEGEEKLFSTLAALVLRTLAGGPERRPYRTVADR